jgi:hypothetical protein
VWLGAGVGDALPVGAGVSVGAAVGAGVSFATGVGWGTGVAVGGGAGGAVGQPKRSEPRPAVHGGAVGGGACVGCGTGVAVGTGVGAAVGGGGDEGLGTDDGCGLEVEPAVGRALDAGFELLAATSRVMTPPGAPLGPATPSVTRKPNPRPPVSSSVPIDRRRARRGAPCRSTLPTPVRCMPLTPFQLRRDALPALTAGHVRTRGGSPGRSGSPPLHTTAVVGFSVIPPRKRRGGGCGQAAPASRIP